MTKLVEYVRWNRIKIIVARKIKADFPVISNKLKIQNLK